MIYSFDVFDTLITRRVLSPADVFLFQADELIREGIWKASETDWQRARMEAEVRARAQRPGGEVTLQLIYDELRSARNLPADMVARAYQLETALEAKLAVFIEANCRQLKRLVDGGDRVVLASDMYLPRSCMQEILKCAGLEHLPLYLSSEHGTTKSSGGLFKILATAEKSSFPQVFHWGDNAISDYQVPKRLGMSAEHYRASRPTESERLIHRSPHIADVKLRALLAGSMRTARLSVPSAEGTASAAVWEIGANIVGPLVLGFVLWVLRQAQDRGLRRLYFVARDGQIACKVARHLCERWGIDIECKYLYGSRQAWHLPATTRLDEYAWSWILQTGTGLSLGSILERLGMTSTETDVVSRELGIAADIKLDSAQIARCRAYLQSIEAKVLERASEKREVIRDYFVQEGFADGVPYGIVDIGWKGRLQRSLSSILVACGLYPANGVQGFYVGLVGAPQVQNRDELHGYMFSAEASKSHMPPGNLGLYELMFSADHPGVTGFRRTGDGRVDAVFRKDYGLLDHGWPLKAQHDGVMRFAGDFAICAEGYVEQSLPQIDAAIASLLRRFFRFPTPAEANAYGAAKFSQEQTEHTYRELAPSVTLAELALLLTKGTEARQAKTLWLEGSIQRTSEHTASVARSLLLRALSVAR